MDGSEVQRPMDEMGWDGMVLWYIPFCLTKLDAFGAPRSPGGSATLGRASLSRGGSRGSSSGLPGLVEPVHAQVT